MSIIDLHDRGLDRIMESTNLGDGGVGGGEGEDSRHEYNRAGNFPDPQYPKGTAYE